MTPQALREYFDVLQANGTNAFFVWLCLTITVVAIADAFRSSRKG